MYIFTFIARYMIEKLRHQCEAALMSGVLVTKENMFPVKH